MHPFPPYFLPFPILGMGHMDSFETWSLALHFHFHIIWPLISFHYPFHPPTSCCFSSIYHALNLPCQWFPFIQSIHFIHSLTHSSNPFISIYYIHSFISHSFNLVLPTHFTQIHLQSIFNSSNPFTSHQFYSNHSSSYHHHPSNLIHVHSSIRHKSKNQKNLTMQSILIQSI